MVLETAESARMDMGQCLGIDRRVQHIAPGAAMKQRVHHQWRCWCCREGIGDVLTV